MNISDLHGIDISSYQRGINAAQYEAGLNLDRQQYLTDQGLNAANTQAAQPRLVKYEVLKRLRLAKYIGGMLLREHSRNRSH